MKFMNEKFKSRLFSLVFIALAIFAFTQKIEGLQNVVLFDYWLFAFCQMGYFVKETRNDARKRAGALSKEEMYFLNVNLLILVYFGAFLTAISYVVACVISYSVKHSEIEE